MLDIEHHLVLVLGYLTLFHAVSSWISLIGYCCLWSLIVVACYLVEKNCALHCSIRNGDGHLWNRIRDCNRSCQSYGLWCTFLLPCAVGLCCNFRQNEFFFLSMLQAPVVLFIFNNVLTNKIVFPAFLFGATLCVSFNLAMLRIFFEYDWILAVALSVFILIIGIPASIYVFCRISRSFTFGEFTIIWQASLLAFAKSASELIFNGTQLDAFRCILYLGYVATFCLLWSCFLTKTFWPNFCFVALTCLLVSYLPLRQDFILFIGTFLIHNQKRIVILLFWMLCVCCTLNFVAYAWERQKLTTIHRKFFHLTISLVALSGLFYDPQLLLFSSVLIFFIFIIVEIIRLLNVQPIGLAIHDAFSKFLDDQDPGPLVLTPIYLVTATFLPLWLNPVVHISDVRIHHFAGFVSVGVGDAAASIFGTILGRHKWKSSKKSVEGTFSSFIAQTAVMVFVIVFVKGNQANSYDVQYVIYLLISCAVISLFETFTSQVDNLVLPLLSFSLFYK